MNVISALLILYAATVAGVFTYSEVRRYQLTKKATKWKAWIVDEEAVQAAAAELGVRRGVVIKVLPAPATVPGEDLTPKKTTYGTYTPSYFRGRHHIKLAANLGPRLASVTLWHELQHAATFERRCRQDGSLKTMYRVVRERYRYSYHDRPIEKEAFRTSTRGWTNPLVKERDFGHPIEVVELVSGSA